MNFYGNKQFDTVDFEFEQRWWSTLDLHWKEIYEITFTYAKFRESFADIISSNNLHEISQITSKVSESDQNYFRKKDRRNLLNPSKVEELKFLDSNLQIKLK